MLRNFLKPIKFRDWHQHAPLPLIISSLQTNFKHLFQSYPPNMARGQLLRLSVNILKPTQFDGDNIGRVSFFNCTLMHHIWHEDWGKGRECTHCNTFVLSTVLKYRKNYVVQAEHIYQTENRPMSFVYPELRSELHVWFPPIFHSEKFAMGKNPIGLRFKAAMLIYRALWCHSMTTSFLFFFSPKTYLQEIYGWCVSNGFSKCEFTKL